ncbi:MAG: hypothetical protein CMJ75_19125 [Planctomycetaceae bacterium]|nr:hypothetical protein [Planctomycetaceae bacterium]
MALKQSAWAKGIVQTPRPQTHGAVHVALFTFIVDAALASADVIEIGELPPFARIVDARVFTEGTFTGITGTVGIVSGEYGYMDDARTSNDVIFSGADLTQVQRMTNPAGLLLAPTEQARGIGVKVSAAVPAAAGKKIHVQLMYTQ